MSIKNGLLLLKHPVPWWIIEKEKTPIEISVHEMLSPEYSAKLTAIRGLQKAAREEMFKAPCSFGLLASTAVFNTLRFNLGTDK